jgi:hypothetical protein
MIYVFFYFVAVLVIVRMASMLSLGFFSVLMRLEVL